jgi:hypothetical protein
MQVTVVPQALCKLYVDYSERENVMSRLNYLRMMYDYLVVVCRRPHPDEDIHAMRRARSCIAEMIVELELKT